MNVCNKANIFLSIIRKKSTIRLASVLSDPVFLVRALMHWVRLFTRIASLDSGVNEYLA